MKNIVFALLLACSLFAAACSRKPAAPAPVVEAAPPQRELSADEKKKDAEAAQAKKQAEAEQAIAAKPADANPDAVLKTSPAAPPPQP